MLVGEYTLIEYNHFITLLTNISRTGQFSAFKKFTELSRTDLLAVRAPR